MKNANKVKLYGIIRYLYFLCFITSLITAARYALTHTDLILPHGTIISCHATYSIAMTAYAMSRFCIFILFLLRIHTTFYEISSLAYNPKQLILFGTIYFIEIIWNFRVSVVLGRISHFI